MFGPPHRKSTLQAPVRITRQTTQLTLDMLRRKAKPKDSPTEGAHSTAQPKSVGHPGPARTTRDGDVSPARDAAKRPTKIHTLAEARACLLVTFRNTHPIFADIIWAEIFEPNLSNAIPDTSHIFARSAPFR